MAHINRRYIDKYWLVFIIRGIIAVIFGCVTLFTSIVDVSNAITIISLFLLAMGIVDAVNALYCSRKRRGWINSVIDSMIDVIAAVALIFFANNNIISSVIIISVYTIVSGIIDIFHGFVSTVDPTDRFIRILTGVCGCVIGLVVLNAGALEIMTFVRFFGSYILIVGITSMIYGVHNRSQNVEDKIARKEARLKTPKKRKK
ncbi:DUF308 domain-containing protein [Candidatus Saccharibacteria bacterium]|nr:DUF308 domain-containing protein [Candidatus Saccharibacteria bacterium]